MKLKDILARELKAWPESVVRISQMTSGDIWGALADGRFACVGIATLADDFGMKPVLRAEWQAAVDALNAPKGKDKLHPHQRAAVEAARDHLADVRLADLIECGGLAPAYLHLQWIGRAYRFEAKPEWSEDGLPNVGTKCVVYKGSYTLLGGQESFIGPVVTVTARFKSARGIEMACVDSGTDLGCQLFRADMCFHLPTAEEIAVREREDAIEEMVAASPLPPLLDKGWVRKNCAALYDANYRKQVTK